MRKYQLLLAVFGLCLTLVGCGGSDDDDGIVIIQSDSGGSLSAVTCSIAELRREILGTTLINYTLFAFPATAVSIRAEYSTNDGATWSTATAGNGGEPTTGLNAVPLGEDHLFAWDTLLDVPSSVNAIVQNTLFRISPFQGATSGAACASNETTISNLPINLEVGSLNTGLARVGEEIGINLVNVHTFSGPMHITIDVSFDPAVLSVTDIVPGPAAGVGSMVTWQLIGSDTVRATLDSGGSAFPDGEIITLIVDTVCQLARALPDSSPIVCVSVSATDVNLNSLASRCTQDGVLTVFDNRSVLEVEDQLLTVGQPPALVPLFHEPGAATNSAHQFSFSITYDAMLLDITDVQAGPALPPAAIITFTPGSGTVMVDISNPAGTPFVTGILAFLELDVVAAMDAITTLQFGNLMASSAACAMVDAAFVPDEADIDIGPIRTLQNLRAVSALAATGTPQMVPGSDAAPNPKGNWAPLNAGEFGAIVQLPAGGNPIIFGSLGDPAFPLVLEATWNVVPLLEDVSSAITATGETTYAEVAGSGFVGIGPNGVLTPLLGNGCTTFSATFTPNGVTAIGAPQTVLFAACVDLGGIDGATRASYLAVGNADADLPGLPLGDLPPGVGGTVTQTVYLNTGFDPVGAYQLTTGWDANILTLDPLFGMLGYVGPSQTFLGGPTLVNTVTPGVAAASHFTVSTSFDGIFDIWTLYFTVLSSGSTALQTRLDQLANSSVPPVRIGAPTPRTSDEATAPSILFP